MHAFTYTRPTTLSEAQQQVQAGGQPLAGGQTLLGALKLRLAAPEQLVDLGAIPGLAGIERENGTLKIGATTRHKAVADSPDVASALPALAELARGIGDRQVRALGTLGGSVANNDPAADYPAALLALDATIRTHQRTLKADEFFQDLFTTALEPGELITAVHFPIPQRAAYVKFHQPASLFALIGVFVAQFDQEVRVAVTGGGNGVFRHHAMEEALNQRFAPEALAGITTDEDRMSADLHGSSAYRAHLAGVMAQRAVARALGR